MASNSSSTKTRSSSSKKKKTKATRIEISIESGERLEVPRWNRLLSGIGVEMQTYIVAYISGPYSDGVRYSCYARGSNPKWNNLKFCFNSNNNNNCTTSTSSSYLTINFYCRRLVGPDHLIGTYKLQLHNIPDGGPHLYFRNRKLMRRGKVRGVFSFTLTKFISYCRHHHDDDDDDDDKARRETNRDSDDDDYLFMMMPFCIGFI